MLTRNNARVGTGIDCGLVDVTIKNAIVHEKMVWWEKAQVETNENTVERSSLEKDGF